MAPNDKHPPAPPPAAPEGERIAKVLSRRGIASRREAERLIEAGEVRVNGRVIDSPALNVTARDRITVSGQPLPEEEPARLWLYYKPEGLVTSAADEKGRDTVFDHLPPELPRVMSVGRLDLNSEGLLLLTNDGALKRRLELPSTGWLRKYRVRVNGAPDDARLAPLRAGITVEGERFQPMQVTLDRVQGANAWLTVGLREGKNREIRRAMSAVGLYVNRLIRISYGPFRLGELQPGEVEEVRARVLREQLGETDPQEAPPARRPAAPGKPPRPAPAAKASRRAAPAEAPAERTPRTAGAGKTTLPRPVRPGDGVRALSRAWKEATTPQGDAPGRRAAPAAAGADRKTRTEAPDRAPRADRPVSKPRGEAADRKPRGEGAGRTPWAEGAAKKPAGDGPGRTRGPRSEAAVDTAPAAPRGRGAGARGTGPATGKAGPAGKGPIGKGPIGKGPDRPAGGPRKPGPKRPPRTRS